MDTPICDFVRAYSSKNAVRFHMPGHKGKSFLGCENTDITEIAGADVLYSPDGIILQSENNASALFGTAHTFYSAEGSSLCIKAMIALAESFCGRDFKILAGRNAHKTFVYACALLDIEPVWMYGEKSENFFRCLLTPERVEEYLTAEKADAVYITSPDYFGNISDIKGIAEVCRKHRALLLVDNAHGAYLKFLPEDIHPITLGADICCDSGHKTLPVLTGGAYLHISKRADSYFCDNARSMLSLFASTSPSYLIMQSLDLCNKYIAEAYRCELENTVQAVLSVKEQLAALGYCLCGSEPLKIVIDAGRRGYTGSEFAEILSDNNIGCEYADTAFTVLMVTPQNTKEDFCRLLDVMSSAVQRTPVEMQEITALKGKRAMKIRDAVFSLKETVEAGKSLGRICASPTVSCPPAIPVAVSGEIITCEAVKVFEAYGIEKIEVVK